MVEYSRSHIKKINSSFVIVPFHQKEFGSKKEKLQWTDMYDVGIYLVVPLLAGLGIGIFLDAKWGTKPICVLSGLLLGLIASFFNLIKIVQRFSKHA